MDLPKVQPEVRKTRKAKQDDSIMDTNNSSIVSKRSVERTHYPEPHFFRYFVKKPKARTPLINLGYWLRMHAIHTVLGRFLEQKSDLPKIVINLGCGYDPLPFQRLSRNGETCETVRFIDVDYPELIERKCTIIRATPTLRDILGVNLNDNIDNPGSAIKLATDRYLAVAADLQDLSRLEKILREENDLHGSMLLFLAEVSLTYMETTAADALIRWTGQFDNVQFCLIEQLLPGGQEHPFARKMLSHFQKMNSPLKSVIRYPRATDQENRFLNARYRSTCARTLWQMWNEDGFTPQALRLSVINKEPFDEWEEFMLFAQHYALVLAWNGQGMEGEEGKRSAVIEATYPPSTVSATSCEGHENGRSLQCHVGNLEPQATSRRFAATTEINNGLFLRYGGLGQVSRLNSGELLQTADSEQRNIEPIPFLDPPRLCHTLTCIGSGDALLIGGRTTPDTALADCWLFSNHSWLKSAPLPIPLYRHSTLMFPFCSAIMVLVYGGLTTRGQASDRWFLWSDSIGWVEPHIQGERPEARFSATVMQCGTNEGLLFGGLRSDCTISGDTWKWSLHKEDDCFTLDFEDLSHVTAFIRRKKLLCRIGAQAGSHADGTILVGGIGDGTFDRSEDIVQISIDLQRLTVNVQLLPVSATDDPMLLVGHNIVTDAQSTVVLGGGATCFSFGSVWNRSSYSITSMPPVILQHGMQQLTPLSQLRVIPQTASSDRSATPMNSEKKDKSSTKDIAYVSVESSDDFASLVAQSQPFIIKETNLGPCTTEWNLETLKEKVGSERGVVVHESSTQRLSFKEKNFSYVKKHFGRFLDEIREGSHQYLRSLAIHDEKSLPAELSRDFPRLADDFHLPAALSRISASAHSSPLRISGLADMWLHYDVMANVLCQIRGSRELRLFPPSDILSLGVRSGESSSDLDVFQDSTICSAAGIHPQVAILEPGDLLFIPPMWAHAAKAISTVSVAVNVFFRNLDNVYAPGKDVYGNRDLQVYENGRRDVKKTATSFDKVPPQIRRFYLERLGQELIDIARHATG